MVYSELLSRPAQQRVGTGLGVVFGAAVAMLTAPPVHRRPGMLERSTVRVARAVQAVASVARAREPMSVPPDPRTLITADEPSNCPADMVEVASTHCPAARQICIEWISRSHDRCARYREWVPCVGEPEPKLFCIDRYEYPNREGVRPTVGLTWEDAVRLCAVEGKRLCTDTEWTVACEGNERLPYPYGYERDSTACNIDRPYIAPNGHAMRDPARRAAEMKRLDQSEPSGARPGCVSFFGVHDMAGHVDEWVVNERGSTTTTPYISGLKGGYWGPVRNRCRPMTTDHNQWHAGYQIGFRCCTDVRSDEIEPGSDTSNTRAIAAIPPKSAATATGSATNMGRATQDPG
jgi:hypothetical protein